MSFLVVDLGKITPPAGTVPQAGDPDIFVANLISSGISLLITIAFVIGLIWMIFAGYSFIFAGDDPKKISSAWSRIYWGLIGLVVVVSSFALVKLVEVVFNVHFLTGPFSLKP